MSAKELKRCLSSQFQVFSGLDESKADRLTLETILGCFYSLDESQRCLPYPKLFSQPDESKRVEKMLELAILSLFRIDKSKANRLTLGTILDCFHSLDESQRCSPYPMLFSQPDESKRPEKMFELVISSLFRLG
jgi:hypothetical protein